MAPITISLIDSSRAFAEIASFLFATFYRERYVLVGCAATIEEGVRLVAERRPEVVLIDLGVDAHPIIPRLRAAGAQIVVVLGSTAVEGYREAALAAGADAFLLKTEINDGLLPTLTQIRRAHASR